MKNVVLFLMVFALPVWAQDADEVAGALQTLYFKTGKLTSESEYFDAYQEKGRAEKFAELVGEFLEAKKIFDEGIAKDPQMKDNYGKLLTASHHATVLAEFPLNFAKFVVDVMAPDIKKMIEKMGQGTASEAKEIKDAAKSICESALKLAPGNPEITPLIKKVGGTSASGLAVTKEDLTNIRMPKAAQSNPQLEGAMLNAYANSGWTETPLRVVITDAGWTIAYDELTKKILFRKIGTSLAVKKPDGTCRIFNVSFKQDYKAGTYGATAFHGTGDSYNIDCVNVGK